MSGRFPECAQFGLWLPFDLPAELKLGTVLLFDIGVYLVVLGAAMLILLTLGEE